MRLSAPGGDGQVAVGPPNALTFTARRVTLTILVQMAYGVNNELYIDHKPSWDDEVRYDLAAKPDGETPLTRKQREPLLQQLLAERLHLAAHREQRMVKGFVLVVAKTGFKLTPGKSKAGMVYILKDGIRGPGMTMQTFAEMLARSLHTPVLDKTGIAGEYDVDLKFQAVADASSDLPSIYTAVEEELGLRLEPAMVPVEFVVIDHVDKVPVDN